MKYFVNILKQFTQAQRLIVLILLLSFTTGSYLVSQYFKTDDCRVLIDENIKMHEDFAKISAMLREERLREKTIVMDTITVAGEPVGGGVVQMQDNSLMDSIYNIVQKHENK